MFINLKQTNKNEIKSVPGNTYIDSHLWHFFHVDKPLLHFQGLNNIFGTTESKCIINTCTF